MVEKRKCGPPFLSACGHAAAFLRRGLAPAPRRAPSRTSTFPPAPWDRGVSRRQRRRGFQPLSCSVYPARRTREECGRDGGTALLAVCDAQPGLSKNAAGCRVYFAAQWQPGLRVKNWTWIDRMDKIRRDRSLCLILSILFIHVKITVHGRLPRPTGEGACPT